MSADDLIAALQQLSAEQRQLPVTYAGGDMLYYAIVDDVRIGSTVHVGVDRYEERAIILDGD